MDTKMETAEDKLTKEIEHNVELESGRCGCTEDQ